MKITICGSMAFSKEMLEAKKQLELVNHVVEIPERTENYAVDLKLQEKVSGWGTTEGADLKIKNDLIKNHYHKIEKSDAILIINKDKNGIKNYIGGNSFLEMGFAHILDKKIYALNPMPEEQHFCYQELIAMQPIILNGNLDNIK